MDETSLRRLLERALVNEPPIGPVARDSLRAGLKFRRRRRAWGVAASTAAVAAIAVAIPAVSGVFGNLPSAPGTRIPNRARGTVYVDAGANAVTPITATNTPGKPIRLGSGLYAIAITP